MSDLLSESDIELLRGVADQAPGSIHNIPTGRVVTSVNVGDGEIERRVRSAGPSAAVPTEIADLVLEPGWEEVRSLIPAERAFRGSVLLPTVARSG